MAIEDLSEDMIDLTEKRLRRLDNSTASAVYKRDRKKFLINKLTAIQAELLGRVEAYNAKQRLIDLLEDASEDAVLLWKRQFNSGARTYTYAAVKVSDGRWWITGRQQYSGLSADQFVSSHLQYANELWASTSWEAVE
jgi:hypothetical protein